MNDINSKILVCGDYIRKDIKRSFDITHIPYIQNKLFYEGVLCPEIIFYYIYDVCHLHYDYLYVEGIIKKIIDCNYVKNVLTKIIEKIDKFNDNNYCKITYYQKIDFYLKNIKFDCLSSDYQKAYKSIRSDFYKIAEQYDCSKIMHGDLDYTNILYNNGKLYLIDFDECCKAPTGMDKAIFFIRLLVALRRNQVELTYEAYNELKTWNIDITLIKIYIIKVISEKMYLLQNKLIDLNDEKQSQDSIDFWCEVMDYEICL